MVEKSHGTCAGSDMNRDFLQPEVGCVQNAPYCHDLVPGSFLLSPEAVCLSFSGFSFPVLIGLADLDENTAECSLSSSGTELPSDESEAQFIKENENHSLIIQTFCN